MPSARVVTWAAILLIPAIFWMVMDNAKNDLITRSRYVAKRAREIGGLSENAPQQFYLKYRFPEGNPSRQEVLLGGLWSIFTQCDAEEVTYDGERKLRRAEDGAPRNFQNVKVIARKPEGGRVEIVLEWVQYHGSWYIDDYLMDGERGRDS